MRRPIAALGVVGACGIAVASLPVVWLAETGRYDPLLLGSLGWLATLATVGVAGVLYSRRRRGPRRHVSWAGQVGLLLGLAAAAALAWLFPANSLFGSQDEGVYANTAIFLAETGSLRVPYPWHATYEVVEGFLGYPGFYRLHTHLEPQFAHLYPTWLALSYTVGGIEAALRLNGLFVLVSGLCFYLLVRTFTSEIIALGATAVFLFNPSQVWIARITLSEPLAQLLTLTCVLLLVWALAAHRPRLAGLAGFVGGIVGLVRLDGLLMTPLLIMGLFLQLCLGPGRQAPIWRACLQTLVPTFGASLAFYFTFSPTYLRALEQPVIQIGVGTIFALYLVDFMVPAARALSRPVKNRWGAIFVMTAILAVASWAYWLRPPSEPQNPEHPYVTDKAASTERAWSLVNLGRYLTPAVLAFAVAGFASAVRRPIQRGRGSLLLPCLVVFGGFSILYLYDPIIDPRHFWAIRRFVPAVVPGFIFFAALALHRLTHRLPQRARGPTAAMCILLTLGALWRDSRHYLFVEENPLIVQQLQEASDRLAEDDLIILPVTQRAWSAWVTPLNLAFGHRIVPIHEATRSGAAGLAYWWTYEHGRQRPVWVLFAGEKWPDHWPAARAVETFVFERYAFENTTRPLPENAFRSIQKVVLYRSDPPMAATGRPLHDRGV